jgi:hypothetical protein
MYFKYKLIYVRSHPNFKEMKLISMCYLIMDLQNRMWGYGLD